MAQNSLLMGLIVALFRNQADSGKTTLLVTVLTALIIVAGNTREDRTKTRFKVLEHPWLLWLGMISYSLYLWHWTVLYSARMLEVEINVFSATILTLVILVLSICSYYGIENPLRKASWGKTPGLTINKGVLVIVSCFAMLSMIQELLLLFYPIQQSKLYRSTTFLGQPKDKCHVSEVNKKTIQIHINKCLPRSAHNKNAIIIGNSHALQYAPMIKAALPGWSVNRMTMWGCSYLPNNQLTTNEISKKGCDVYGESIKNNLSQHLQPNDIVFIGYTVIDGIATPMLKQHISELAQSIKARRAHLVIFDDIYSPPYEPEDCEPTIPMILGIKHKSNGCTFRIQSAKNYKALFEFDNMMKDLDKNGTVTYISARNWICPDGFCRYRQVSGFPTFDYESHLFEATSSYFGPMLHKELSFRAVLRRA